MVRGADEALIISSYTIIQEYFKGLIGADVSVCLAI